MFCITPELYAALKRTGLGPREVRVGDVRFGSHFGLKSDIAACPKSATKRLMRRTNYDGGFISPTSVDSREDCVHCMTHAAATLCEGRRLAFCACDPLE
jgi:hypothetical protein